MPERTIHIRPTPIDGPRARVVPLYDGTILPAEGRRVVVDRHVRMLLRDGDVEEFTPTPRAEPVADESGAASEASAEAMASEAHAADAPAIPAETPKTKGNEPAKKHRASKEQSE